VLRIDCVSLSQRSLFAECERQQTRLIQVLRWYDHQKLARGQELSRQTTQITNEIRRQSGSRSKYVLRERTRLKHLIDIDRDNDLPSLCSSVSIPQKSSFQLTGHIDDHKRKVYGCLLPEFKASLTRSSDKWSQINSNSFVNQSRTSRSLIDKQRSFISRHLPSLTELENRKKNLLNKCLYEFDDCQGCGYDHFLRTSEPNRNAQVLAQQILNDKNPNKYR